MNDYKTVHMTRTVFTNEFLAKAENAMKSEEKEYFTITIRFLQKGYMDKTFRIIRPFGREKSENRCRVVMHRLIHSFHR